MMKRPKQQKPHSKLLYLSLLAISCIALLVIGSYAAYTSSKSVKRVVVARTLETNDKLRFSSNYLDQYDNNRLVGGYAVRPVSVNSSGDVTIGITVCNYPQDDFSSFNDTTINYTMTITYPDGYPVNNPVKLTGVLPGGTISSNLHKITIAEENVSVVSNGFIEVVVNAEPVNAVDGKILAARLQIISTSAEATPWKGEILDTTAYKDTDAINFHISGTKECDMVLSWNNNKVELSKWSKNQLSVVGETTNSLKIHVGGADQPTSYLLQFYRKEPIATGEEFSSLSISLETPKS